jgi:hypothetical protein
MLTRNTFDPLNTLLERLGVVQEIQQTSRPQKGLANLIDTLDEGIPAMVWADHYSLPYNALPLDAGMWAMFPILVYGFDEAQDTVWIADRAKVPLTVTPAELEMARARVKKDKFRLLTLDHPNPDKLPTAVQKGIWDCIKLYTETPPKGSKNNFGFAAFKWWTKLLTQPKQRLSWAKVFPPGPKMLAGLTSTFNHVAIIGKEGGAERGLYADFLTEASLILAKPALNEVADRFRASAQAWDEFGWLLLPDEIPPFKETRALMLRRHHRFLEEGNTALPEIQAIDSRLSELKTMIGGDFPLDEAAVTTFCDRLADHLMKIHDIELTAITMLQQVMA